MNDQILDLLVSRGLITDKIKTIAQDLVARGKTLEQALVGGKYVPEVDFAKTVAEVTGIAYEDLGESAPDPEVVKLIPKATLDNFQMIPYKFDGKTLEVILRDPQDYRAVEALEFLTSDKGWGLKIATAPASQIKKFTKDMSGLKAEVQTALEQAKGKF
ncbi:MAG: hypothetical protein WCW31_00570, partial [Patescibacteria group bacterium]